MQLEYDLRPTYYDDFHCLAENCRFTCCKGWRITLDKKEFMALKRMTGSVELNARMVNALHRIRNNLLSQSFYGEFRLPEGGDCPLHCENGLCLLQLEKGHEALPWVCRTFPRYENPSVSGYLERALSPACEGTLALLWDLPEGVDFCADPLKKRQNLNLPKTSSVLINYFQDIRSQCIDFLQDRRLPLPQRIMLIGLALKGIVEGETDIERWMTKTQFLLEQAVVGKVSLEVDQHSALPKFVANNVRFLHDFGTEQSTFSDLQRELTEALNLSPDAEGRAKGALSTAPYLDARARYELNFAGREYFMENLMVSLFFQLRYPVLDSTEGLWKSYVDFCSLYSIYRFLTVMSCRDGAAGDRDELFRLLVYGSRMLIHNGALQAAVRDSFFNNDSATLAHMAILLSG